jgi:hypothetical protein
MTYHNFRLNIPIVSFAKFPDFFIRMVCGQIDSNETCYLTFEDIRNLRHCVKGSDGNIYDAVQLKKWVNQCSSEGKAICVIPGNIISYVTTIISFKKQWWDQTWIPSFFLKKATQHPRRQMFLRVVDNNTIRKLQANSGTRKKMIKLQSSTHSAFQEKCSIK